MRWFRSYGPWNLSGCRYIRNSLQGRGIRARTTIPGLWVRFAHFLLTLLRILVDSTRNPSVLELVVIECWILTSFFFSNPLLASSKDRILKSVEKLVEKEKMSAESAEEALGKIEFTTDPDALKDVDFVVEAVVENIDLKRDLYTKLGDLCKPDTVFASNTSSLSIGGTFDRTVCVHRIKQTLGFCIPTTTNSGIFGVVRVPSGSLS